MEKPSFEKPPSQDPFKEPHHELPTSFRVNQSGNRDPYRRDFFSQLLDTQKKVEVNHPISKKPEKLQPKTQEGLFGEKGISRYEVKGILRKAYRPGGLSVDDRLAEEQHLDPKKYGEKISDSDVEEYVKELDHIPAFTPLEKKKELRRRSGFWHWLLGKK